MSTDTTGLCRNHSFETAQEVCRRCGHEFCELCVLYPFGPSKPLCKECAMVAGGVRNHSPLPEMPKRDLKRKVKAFEQQRRAAAARALGIDEPGGAPSDEPVLSDPLAPTPEDLERVPAPVPDTGGVMTTGADHRLDAPPPPPGGEPADGVAPPIDWSRPFG